MKIFNLSADTTEKQEYHVDLDSNGEFICPVCQKTYLKFINQQYHSTDPAYRAPRAECSNCSAVFLQFVQR